MKTILWWIRRDLRLHDNPTLQYALAHADRVVPVFIMDPILIHNAAPKRLQFLNCALRAFDESLRARGSRLIVRAGDCAVELRKLAEETSADFSVAEDDYSPYAIERDRRAKSIIEVRSIHGLCAQPPEAVLKQDGSAYTIFTPFARTWKNLPDSGAPSAAPEHLPAVPEQIQSLSIPPAQEVTGFPSNEDSARKRLEEFLSSQVVHYDQARNEFGAQGTSQLSPYLKFGMISARECVHRIKEFIRNSSQPIERKNGFTWLNELIWREFFFSILHHFPEVTIGSFRQNLRGIKWREDKKALKSWRDGLTGYPIVDAGMRELLETGWMHNRARMICASFLTKDLLINWQIGERWFMGHLIDGDTASNNGGWQWTAGTGTDAAPFFRIFNPILQSQKFDADGTYIRRWVPELRNLPTSGIHTPWKAPELAPDYPSPIVDHAQARLRALEAYKHAKYEYENKHQ